MPTKPATPIEYACALLLRGGQVLLGLRAGHKRNFPNCWDTIGGHVEAGERPVDALARELKEELGVVPTHVELLETLEELEDDGATPALWRLYIVRAWEASEPAICNDEHTEIRWFDLADAQQLTPIASPSLHGVFSRLQAAETAV